MRKESYQRTQSKLQSDMDGLKAHISKQDEQRAKGLDGVIHEVCEALVLGSVRGTGSAAVTTSPSSAYPRRQK